MKSVTAFSCPTGIKPVRLCLLLHMKTNTPIFLFPALERHLRLGIKHTFQSIPNLEFFQYRAEPACINTIIQLTGRMNIPVTPDLSPKLQTHILKISGRHFRKSRMAKYHSPSHNRRNLAVKVQPLTEIQQVRQIRFRQIPRLLGIAIEVRRAVTEWHLGLTFRIRFWRARSHQGVTAEFALGIARSLDEELDMVHTRSFKPMRREKASLATAGEATCTLSKDWRKLTLTRSQCLPGHNPPPAGPVAEPYSDRSCL